jgi:hypothetical protein
MKGTTSVQARPCIPELYFLKYRGIPTPWDCESNTKRVGFKCIKYASWKDVHTSAESAALLREIGSALVDEGYFPRHLYGGFALVWERVRRWASDKEGLSIEPDFTPEFESSFRTMSLGSRDERYVSSFMRDNIVGFSTADPDAAWAGFKQLVVANLFAQSKTVRSLPIPVPKFDVWVAAAEHRNALDEFIVKLYSSLGFDLQFEVAGEAIDLLLEELGLAFEPPAMSFLDHPVTHGSSDVLVEWKDRLDLRLLEAKQVGNSMVLTLNGRHPALQADSPYSTFFADVGQWQAFGRACRDNLGHLEEVQSLLDSWGVHLASVVRAFRRAEGHSQHG